jgi:hypothetical protein
LPTHRPWPRFGAHTPCPAARRSAERLTGMQTEGDLLPVGQRQPPRSRPERSWRTGHRAACRYDQRHSLMRTAHLGPGSPTGPGLHRSASCRCSAVRRHPLTTSVESENLLDSPTWCVHRLNPPPVARVPERDSSAERATPRHSRAISSGSSVLVDHESERPRAATQRPVLDGRWRFAHGQV